ncbi:LysR family transcriptional regulator [Roseovarius sp.]
MIERESPERIMREMDWNLLRTFVVLAQSRSVTDAATRLRLTQPSVSTALKRLENKVGKKLIDRSPGRFELTDAGQVLYREAVDIQGSILRLSTLMRDMTDEVTGHVRLSLASHVICPLFNQVLAEFHAENPRATLTIDVFTSALAIESVTTRSASFAICLVHSRNSKLEYKRLFREYFGLFCGPPHPLFGRKNLTRADLAGHSAVSFGTDRLQDALKPVTLMRAQAELGDQIIATSSHLEEVRRMIIAGLGVGPLPLHVAARDVRDGQLWQLPPYDQTAPIDVHVVWNPRAVLNRAEKWLLDRLLQRIDETPMDQRTYR